MAVPLEKFVQQLEETGIISGETLKGFIPPQGSPKDAEDLARQLVKKKQLTRYQAEEVYRGKGKSLVLGNYILMEKIGSGGMGQVFKAHHRRMDRCVAIKLLPPEMTKDKDAIARFEREVKAAAKISHPNIVAAHDADCANGVHFLVMELVEGIDLSALVKKQGPVSIGKVISYILQAAKGLEAAHKKGVIHRDIKPANLLLDTEGTVKILDMGLARLSGEVDSPTQAELTSTGTVMGTVDYMAPEQALNTKTADGRADIYALGCSLHYLLSGKSTYDGDTLMAKLLAHRDQPIPALRAVNSEVPEELETVFRKMVAKKIEDRYQTATLLIADLQKCSHGNDPTVVMRALQDSEPEFDMMSFLSEPAMGSTKKAMVRPRAAKKTTGNDRNKLLLGGGILGVLVLLAGIIVSMRTQDGTLVVTVSETDAEVQVLNGKGQIEITRQGEKTPTTISVDPGKHRLKVQKDGFTVFGQDFEIASGGTQPITAKLEPLPGQPAAVASPPVATTPAAPVMETPSLVVPPSNGVKQPLAFQMPGFDEWVKGVAALPAEQQVEAVSKKLVELNPGFDGKVTHEIVNGVVYLIAFDSVEVTDLSPLRALVGLCVANMPSTRVNGRLTDLAPLSGLTLTALTCAQTSVSDLSPLRGLPLQYINCFCTHVSDLSPLSGMSLTGLNCSRTPVTSLSPLKGMPIGFLCIQLTRVTDLSPLQGMPLTSLIFHFQPKRDTELLRSITTLTQFNNQTADEFWKDYSEWSDPSLTIADPAFLQWMKETSSLTAEAQVTAVTKKLQELNPSFDGKVEHQIEAGVVTSLQFVSDDVWNIAPVRALTGLKSFDCNGSKGNGREGKVVDLSPLAGMQLTEFHCGGTLVFDLSPLRGMPLTKLNYGSAPGFDMTPLQGMPLTWLNWSLTPLSDLTPLKGLPLQHLQIDAAFVTDLSPIRGMPLAVLYIAESHVADLSPLAGMPIALLGVKGTNLTDRSSIRNFPIKWLFLDYNPARDAAWLRSMTTLEIINDKTVAEFWKAVEANPSLTKPLGFQMPGFDEWVKQVSALPAEQQVEAVSKKLVELNPGFDGKLTNGDGQGSPAIEGGVVTILNLVTDQVTDISPVRALPGLTQLYCSGSSLGQGRLVSLSPLQGLSLAVLHCGNSPMNDLSALRGLPLVELSLHGTSVSDLSPLRGMKLIQLNCANARQIDDLSPLQGMPLNHLVLQATSVSDLSPLTGMPLDRLNMHGASFVSDLTPLQGMKLSYLSCYVTQVTDLTPLKDMPLTELYTYGSHVADYSILKGMPLKILGLNFRRQRDAELLRTLTSLETINEKPAAEFWKEVDERQASIKPITTFSDPGFQKWEQDVAALTAEEQVKVVSQKLVELNPRFDGRVTPHIHEGVAWRLEFVTDQVTDISPVRAIQGLKELSCSGSESGVGKLHDLSPLQGLPLTNLMCRNTEVDDLLPLRGMPLTSFNLQNLAVTDLTPLQGMPLTTLFCDGCDLSDISPLKGMPLIHLQLGYNHVADLSPLKGMPITFLYLDGTCVTDLSPLKDMPLTHLTLALSLVKDLTPLNGMSLTTLNVAITPVADLSPLTGMPLTNLYLFDGRYQNGTNITDHTPLRGLPLHELTLNFQPERDGELLRSIKTLEVINDKPVAAFWKETEKAMMP